ncbi:hypothetical protein AY600_01780 [Phormidium willei BDU 130791]|jgi:hypothetical protein|nr:hypothetical protein AY600_01780 [Phormidium willei BDU 130791]
MKFSFQLPMAIMVSVSGLVGLGFEAIAQRRPREPIIMSCGTGCRVTSIRVSEIETIEFRDGSVANTALFASEQVRNYGLPNQYVAFSGTSRYFAVCSSLWVGSSEGEDYVPNPDWWRQLRGDRSDYAPVAGGMVYYFDELCR